uniref:Uncharacterized protein n=1 Tax=Pristionchus pacificus TaxID=54126 RepID=A0A8R1YCS1_PRIPA
MHSDNATSHLCVKQSHKPQRPLPLPAFRIIDFCIFENHLFSGLIKRARMRSRTLLLAAALVAVVASFPRFFGGRNKGGFVQLKHELEGHVLDSRLADSDVTGIARIDQKIDHFNDSDARTFRQRYFFNNEHNQDKRGNVNFLYLSGEQTASLNMISGTTKPIMQQVRGEFVRPRAPILRRLAAVPGYFDGEPQTLNANSGSPDTQKWIIVGGSYAGALSAWARQLHPELIVGSIASSAPILAQFDFYGYLETVDKNVKAIPACYNQLKTGIDKIVGMLESKNGRDSLDKKFPHSPKFSAYADLQDNDVSSFFSYVTDVFEGASQYGDPKSVQGICDEFTNHAVGYDPVDALADLVKKYMVDPKTNTFDFNYTQGIVDLSDTSYSDDTDYTGRLWTWQTCTEFGYFQSTDRGDNVFQSIVPVNLYSDMCADLFDMDVATVKKAIDDVNAFYGQRDYYTGTKVFLAHGSVDPWSYLTKQQGTQQHWSVVIEEVAGGTHCSDLNPACDSKGANCNAELKRVQQLTQENIDQWLNGPFTAPDSVKLTDSVGKRPNWYDGYVPSPIDIRANGAGKVAGQANRAKRSTTKRNAKKFRRNVFTGKTTHHLLPPPVEAMRPEWPVNIEEGRVDQPWDHFNPNDERQFQQRFYVNEMYVKTDANGAKSKTAPNFLMIGGEGPESDAWVTNEGLAWMKYAKEVGANVYILEHRYYGASKLKTTDLQFLTSSQMLYDVARFISIVKRDRSQTGPWITFGGSYPGALAAWSREWFPELILGAVGSSGPVLAKNDFWEYLQVVENVLRAKSDKCASRTQEAFDQLRQLTHDAAGRNKISNKFNLNPAWPNNVNNVFGNLYGLFQDIVQYSDDNNSKGRDYTVTELCSLMEDEGRFPDVLDAVRYVQMWVYDDYGMPETGSDPQRDFDDLKDMWKYIDGHADNDPNRPWSDDDLASVLWTWQTCNEFGYYQTTDYGYGLFGNPVPLNFFITMCEQVFGVSMDHVEKGVARSNYQYGGRDRYSATNVVLPNGNHDPWHALGITKQGTLDPSVVPILIDGTAHCADMYAARDEDSAQLVAARNTILSNIKKWLNGGTNPDTPTQGPQTVPPVDTTTRSASHLSTIVALLAPVAVILAL